MKNYIKIVALSAVFLTACEAELDNPIEDGGVYTSGSADFSNYVAVGNSLTSGYADGALYITGQQNSFPNILAGQFALVGGGEFTQPLMNDNLGGLVNGGTALPGFQNRFVLSVDGSGNPGPVRLEGSATTDITNILSGPFNNMGVPGAKSFHLVAPGYGNIANLPAANPYFVRFASSPNATVIADAVAQSPSFFSLWIGNNDILSYATSGGVGVDQKGNLNPASYGPNDITDPNVFASVYSQEVEALDGSATGGVLFNIPDVTSIPFFTTVPNNALVLTAEQAASLTGFFRAVSGIFIQGAIQQGVPATQAQALGAQYAIRFSAGPNRFIIDVPVTQTNPLGFRQMTQNELLLLTINQAALRTQGYGSVALSPQVLQVLGKLQQQMQITPQEAGLVLAAVNGIDDKDALDTAELTAIANAQTAYNATISNVAQARGLALVDARATLQQLANGGISYDAGTLTSTFATGGAFSLDGVHPTPRGYAYLANLAIDAINATYGSTVPKVNIGDYNTITASQAN
ncbi:G-D-S-L family lipolytic protein [Leeuwenhoekiella sp. H156]|uniref:G-D-S-L family lipolytic protein n=1 Tax=Leeuwenhoekiella sp. H156 TaxID=3450128 RepID=UPI003FA4C200